MPCGSICPASDALCIAGFKQASACQPPTREICCIGPGIVEELYNAGYNVYVYIYISKYIYVYFEGLHKNHAVLTSFALKRMVGAARSQPNVSNNAAWLAVSPEIGPQFPEHGAGNRAPISGKTPPPEIGAQFGPLVGGIERLQACAPPTRPNSGGQHSHTSSIATWPSTKSKIQNPNSKRPVWILDFGFWILDFGFWILDFGFWILDQFSLRSFCGGPKRPRLDFGFRILDFGFRILG